MKRNQRHTCASDSERSGSASVRSVVSRTIRHLRHDNPYIHATLKALCVSVVALLLSLLLSNPLSASLSGIFSSPERNDFRITDLYAQVAESRPVRQFDDRIVLVDIGHADRSEIAEYLQILSFCDPKAVGIDINFGRPTDAMTDSVLTEALAMLPQAILPLGVEDCGDDRFRITDCPFFYSDASNRAYGVVNLPSEKENASIREFATDYKIEGRGKTPSFVMALADMGGEGASAEARKRGNQHETIDYPSREFRIIPIEEIEQNAEALAGRYVLVGAMVESTDMHSTPINSYMAGMQIHAYSLSTLLDRKWFAAMPTWIDYVTAMALCFVVLFSALTITNLIRGLTLRLIQIFLLFLIVWIGYGLYIDRAIVCDFSHTLIMLAFGLLALDVWNGIEGLGKYTANILRTKKIRKCEPQY